MFVVEVKAEQQGPRGVAQRMAQGLGAAFLQAAAAPRQPATHHYPLYHITE